MTTSEESTEEEEKGGDDSQNNDFISLGLFELLKWIIRRDYSPLLQFLLFYDVGVDLDLYKEGELLEMDYEYKLQPVSQ